MGEHIFLDRGNVIVSNSRFIVSGQTYAMSNVTSVKSGIKKREWEAVPLIVSSLFLIIISGLFFLIGIDWIVLFVGGLAVLGGTVILLYIAKTQYTVILITSAGENQALVSEDKSCIEDVIRALNAAIVSRG